jgi:MoaA/NifB/PqqE/SkfB family radical SAM enzyme
MIKDEYSPYKIIHHLDKIEELKDGKQTVPLQMHIVPANVCNQACHFCAYRMKDYLSNQNFDDRQILSTDKIKETLDCAADMGIKAIQYTGGGEPLVHPEIHDIFKYTLDKGLDLSLVSNGMALTESMCETLSYASWVRISVDAGIPETYGFIRNVPKRKYNDVINNIKCLVKHKKENIIGVGFVVNKENYKEVVIAAKTFKDIGVDNFRISAAFTPIGYEYFDGFMEEAKELAAEAATLSDGSFTVFNLFNDRVKDTFEGTQDYDYCPIKDLQVYLGADYKLYTCCTLAYNDKGEIGSIKNQTFKELWEGDTKTSMYSGHCPSKHCKFPCMYKGKNDFINYCIKKDPNHINFI